MKKILLSVSLIINSLLSIADEGMWLPQLLKQLNEPDMKKLGMRMSAEDIYSVNNSSLKDAVVHFGGGCTAEIISQEGLLLTNHHCGFGQIQHHSSVQNDLLKDGFWAKSKAEELPNEGLTATFIIRIDDVTKQVLEGTKEGMPEADRNKIIEANSKKIEAEAVKGTRYDAKIRSFFYGNEFYMFITQTFKDVRLVGAPPSSIGKFGGETDNWMWPRHTGDFSMFRIYADANNEPAEYSPNNKPYVPKRALNISLKGVNEGDFTLTFGFPGQTFEYLPSYGIRNVVEVSNPIKIAIRDIRLSIWEKEMKADPVTRIMYASKYARIANYYKKFKGENKGLRLFNGIDKKEAGEKEFTAWVNAAPDRKKKYGAVLNDFKTTYDKLNSLQYIADLTFEAFNGIEIFNEAYKLNKLVELSKKNGVTDEEIAAEVQKMKNSFEAFYHDYNHTIDYRMCKELFDMYYKHLDKNYAAPWIAHYEKHYRANSESLAHDIFKKSMLADEKKFLSFLSHYKKDDYKHIEHDLSFEVAHAIRTHFNEKVFIPLSALRDNLNLLERTYIQALREMQPNKSFWPDANSTMRVAYGKVAGFKPFDGAYYNCFTTLDGIIEKMDSTNEEFTVPKKMVELYNKKDYGRYASNGTVPVAFIATNHTTGGNSGSPLFDADGNLIGLNFDTNWEGTMSNYLFNPGTVRNICVDVRYVMFIIEKYAGADNLIKEMKFVQ